jgi:DNA ligase (NAD+)
MITKWCRNDLCKAKVSKNIDHWFKKLNVKGIGEGIINKLCNEETNSFDEPVVSSISDMYNLNHYKYELEELFGPKAFGNIIKAVNSVTTVSLGQFIEALGVAQIGRMSHDLAKVAKTIAGVDKLSVKDIVKLEGFSDIKANKFVDGWKVMRDSGEIDNLLKYITIEEKVQASSSLEGKSFCVTGTLSKGRKEVAADIEANGGTIKSSVGKSLDYLVAGENAGSKIDKAKKNGVSIITEEELVKMMK